MTETLTLREARLAFIGGGMMAQAMIHALLEAGESQPDHIIASDPVTARRALLQTRYGIHVTDNNVEAIATADIIVLAIKPQMATPVMQELQGRIPTHALVLSIIAGTPIAAMRAGLQHEAIIRTMPNTPAQISAGMTVWTASPAVTLAQREQAQAILKTFGVEMCVAREEMLDMATAVSGTGPTYIFLLMEAWVDAAVHLGFSRQDALTLVFQTAKGSVAFAEQSNLHLAELRNMVTSPGGTSAEAIYQLEKGGMRTILSKAIWAAYQKSQRLGQRAQEPPLAPLKVDNGS